MFILRYSINKSNYLGENVGFKSELIDSKLLNQKKPINMITMMPEMDKMLYLSDSVLYPVNLSDLEPAYSMNTLRLKNVTTYCYNEKYNEKSNKFGLNANSLLCVCSKGRFLQLFTLNYDQVTLFKEINLPELCLQIELNQNHICVACDNCYLVVNILNGSVQKLFDYDIEHVTPCIVNYDEGEFFLNCQGMLGMFASFDGQSTRPPIAWQSMCTQFQISNPYVLCMNGEQNAVDVYSLIDLKLKQQIQLVHMKTIKHVRDDDFFIISTQTQICALNAASKTSQVEQLLKSNGANRIDEAISLFQILNSNLDQQKYDIEMKKLKIKVAFIELIENGNFSNAQEHFLDSNIDYKQIAKLVPNLISKQESEGESGGGEVEKLISDCQETFKRFLEKKNEREVYLTGLKTMLIDYMLKMKPAPVKTDEYVQMLFRLCVDCNSVLLNQTDFFTNLPLTLCLKNVNMMQESERYHSVALVYQLLNQNEDALNLWTSLCDGKLSDAHFPGYDYVIAQLTKLKDHQLVWKYLDWAMAKNETKAVEIFTKRSTDELSSERMRVDTVLEYLKAAPYKSALIIYLENLIFKKSIKKEKYNTELASIYLESVINMVKVEAAEQTPEWKVKFDSERSKLQHMLEYSSNYRVQLILAKIKEYETVLQKECAILYGKIEEHEKALKILVYTLSDYKSACEYCVNMSKDSLKQRKHLFSILFSIYMNPAYSEKEKLLGPTLDLLNNSRYSTNFDFVKLIELIPNTWSMKLTSEFLSNGLRTNLVKKRLMQVQKSIANNYRFQLQSSAHELKKELLYIDEDSQCSKCHKTFESSIFIKQPNGKLSHTMCKSDLSKLMMPKFEYA